MSDLVQQPGGGWAETPPTHCPAGHPLLPRTHLVGFQHCTCTGEFRGGGHRTYQCRTVVDGRECGAMIYVPEHTRDV